MQMPAQPPQRPRPPENKSFGRCLNCGQPRRQRYRPFCSKRCADLDLGRWLKGAYRIESSDGLDDEDLRDAELGEEDDA